MLEDQFTELKKVTCPYCGEPIELVIEQGEENQRYIEDCEVCCQPIVVDVFADGEVQTYREQEA
ncbi:MAG: CPXCG motif-containing cysteine-rich protein [Reinekea sp.]|jgi:hypothetical protein